MRISLILVTCAKARDKCQALSSRLMPGLVQGLDDQHN